MLKLAATVAVLGTAYAQTLPIVDLGYELHQASDFNDTGRFYNFSNIRYAAPPIGNLRFAPPEAPETNRSSVNVGDVGRICPQAAPAWNQISTDYITNLLLGLPTNASEFTQPYIPPVINESTPVPAQDPRASEDCLFLDVFVPEKIFNAANESSGYGSHSNNSGAPVLVWIYGGGYTMGDKFENPAGLLAQSGGGNGTDGELIYVALNYRLGALGFISGPTYQSEGGISNLALLDQRFALEWVQENIHLFGGDPNRVTVLGESAGGGSIMHQITAYGGSQGPAPFQQAIPQSPGFLPITSQLQQEDIYQAFLNITNTTSLEELRQLSEEDIIRANTLQVLAAPYGTYVYGPVVDGNFTPAQPGQLLANGQFDKNVSLLIGHNSAEGDLFTPPYINSTSAIAAQLRGVFPYLPEKSLSYLTDDLYPEPSNSTPYTTELDRAILLISDAVFTCNTRYLSTAYDNETYSYLFSVPPGLHGQDIAYTYFEGGATSASPVGVTNTTIAYALQDFIASFAITGKPSAEGVVEFRQYGDNATLLELNVTTIAETRDSNVNRRCDWWQKALYT